MPALLKAMSRPAEALRPRVDQPRHRPLAHVAGERDGLAAGGLDIGDQRVQFAPAAARRRRAGALAGESSAVARPMPELAPVTMATLLESVEWLTFPLVLREI